jgi:hypothetical protein
MHLKQRYRRVSSLVAIVAIILVAYFTIGCSEALSASPTGDSLLTDRAETASHQLASSESAVTGVWQGSTLADCGVSSSFPSRCNAEQKVTITLMRGPNSKISGRYTCSYGNMDCYHANDTGRVAGVSMSGRRMNIRVIMPDGTSCIFSGPNLEDTVNGGYSCYQGGALIEQGSWRAERSY